MYLQISRWLEPPGFPGDEEKTAQARIMNTLIAYFALTLVIGALVLVPFYAQHKAESWLIILTLLIVCGVARSVMFSGRLDLAAIFMVAAAWIAFEVIAIFSGGIASPAMFGVIAVTLISGLLVEPRIGHLFVGASLLAGLGLTATQQVGVDLSRFLVPSPIATWFVFALALVFMNALADLVVRDLRIALTFSRQQSKALEQAERALRQSEERFQMFMRYFPGLAYIKDSDGKILFVNQGFRTFLGLDPESMIGKTNLETFGPEFGEKISRDDQRVLESGTNEIVEEEFGGRTWTTDKFSINQPGVKPLLGGVTIDITERKRAELALQQSEQRFRQLFESHKAVMLLIDPASGTILDANPAAVHFYGYAREALGGMSIDDINTLTPDQVAIERQKANKEERDYFNFSHRLANGEIRAVEVRSSPIDTGAHRVLFSIVQDITERKRAEDAAYRAQQMLQLVLDTIPQRVFWKDRGLNFLGCNRPFAIDAGLHEPGDLIGKSDYEMAWKDVADLYRADDRGVIETARAKIDYEEPQSRLDGSTVWLRTSKVPLHDRQGQVFGILGTYEDITERKRAEQELLRQTQELTTLYEVGEAFGKTLEPAEILEQIYAAVGAVLDNRNLYIALYDQEKQSISFPLYTINGAREEPSTRPFGAGLTEYVVRTKSPLLVPRDLPAELERLGIATIGTPSCSLLAVPMIVGDRVLGVMAIQDYERADAFDAHHQELLSTLASQAAIALENAQLFKETKERAEQLATLNQIGQAVSARLEVESVLETIYQQLNRVLPLDTFYVALYDQEHNRLSFPLLYDNGKRYHQTDTSLTQETHTIRVIKSGAPLLINRKPAEMSEQRGSQIMIGNQTRRAASLLFTPLRQGNRILGVLSVQSYTFNAYNEEHLSFLNGIASQVTIALENAQLFERTERNLQRMQALHEIDKAISSTHDLRATFDTYLTHLMAQLDVDAAAVLLLRGSTQTLEYAAGRGFRTPALQHTHLRLGEGIAGRVALERRIQFIPDLEKGQEDLARSPLLAEEGFVTYFGVPLVAKGQLSGVLEIFHRRAVSPDREWLVYLEMLATQAAIALENMMLFDDLQQSNAELSLAYDTTLEGWSRALDLRDQETEGHTQRVTEMAVRLGRQVGIRENELVHLRRGALLHDIGKMGIPDSILLKPGPLTPGEWETMRQHPVIAYRLLSPITHLRFALDVPYCHHEKWDGTGYPRGLKGEEIPFVARLFAAVDVWDALRSDRPYRPAWAKEQVLEYIRSEAGRHFDPQIVDIFLKVVTDEH